MRLAVGAVLLALVGCGTQPPASTPSPSLSPSVSTVGPTGPNRPVVTACWSATKPADGTLRFADQTVATGLESPLVGMMAHAVAAGDVNNDGWVDLFVGTFADRPLADYATRGASGPTPDRLLWGSAQGFRVDPSFPGSLGRTSGAAFADLDADGDLDLVISRNPRSGQNQSAPSQILRNDGGSFTVAAVLDPRRGGRSVGVADFDQDGLLDIVLIEDRWTGGSSAIFRNRGALTFEEATGRFGLPAGVHGLGVATADLDQDGHPDLFVAGSNRLFLHVEGRLVEQDGATFSWPVYGDEDDPAGVAVADLDRDGRPDLVVGEHYGSTVDKAQPVPIRVYLNRGPGDGQRVRFADVTAEAGLPGLLSKAPHVDIADVDADGRPDLITSAVAADGRSPLVLLNDTERPGALRFRAASGVGRARYWVTGVSSDVDHDGTLDLLFAEWDPALPSPLLSVLGAPGRWLSVQVGPAGSLGVGAVVEVFAAGHLGESAGRLGSIEITASSGFGAGREPVARFGVGEHPLVDLRVHPPGGGDPIDAAGVPTDSFVSVQAACP